MSEGYELLASKFTKIFCETVMFMLMTCRLPLAAAEAEKRVGVRVDWLELKETLPSGHKFVKESGPRVEGYLDYSAIVWGDSEITYRGAFYGTFTRHYGDDPTHLTIPNGMEDTWSGQIGTRHSVTLWVPIVNREMHQAGPTFAVGFDAWYRPLAYYEIWQIPSASLGIRVKSILENCPISFDVGVRRSINAKVRTETTHPPWNASSDTTLALGDRNNIYVSVAMSLKMGWIIGLHYEEQKYGASAVYPLSSGIGIFQPHTTIKQIGISGNYRF